MGDENERRVELHRQVREHLTAAREKAFEQFDSAVLGLSTGALGVSLAFLDGVVELKTAMWRGVLVVSWGLFTIAIVSTLLSFIASQKAIDHSLRAADDYYLRRIEEAASARNRYAAATRNLNLLSASAFVLAVLATVFFVSRNILD